MEVLSLLYQFTEQKKHLIRETYNFNDAISDIKFIEDILKKKIFNYETIEIDAKFNIFDIRNYKHLSNDKQLLREIKKLTCDLLIKYNAYFTFEMYNK
jgi:hypothetical protein